MLCCQFFYVKKEGFSCPTTENCILYEYGLVVINEKEKLCEKRPPSKNKGELAHLMFYMYKESKFTFRAT